MQSAFNFTNVHVF